MIWESLTNFIEVPNAKVVPAQDGQGNYFLYGPGLHLITDPFITLSEEVGLAAEKLLLSHGTITLVVIPLGQAGYAEDRGQPVILPDGMHCWNSPTLKFVRIIPTDEHIVQLGPMTLVTLDEGYVAVTQNNGRQVILEGGMVHLLTHRNWKFQKLVPLKQETMSLGVLDACTQDFIQVKMAVTCTWRIADPAKTCLFCVQTMNPDGSLVTGDDIDKIRNDVKMQAIASLCYVVGNSCFISEAGLKNDKAKGTDTWLDSNRLRLATKQCNEITSKYGVEVVALGILNMQVSSKILEDLFAKMATVTSEAIQAEKIAEGEASAIRISATAMAEALKLEAKGHLDAAKALAQTSSGSPLAFELARLEAAGTMFNPEKHQFLIGDCAQGEQVRQLLYPDMLTAMMNNPTVMRQLEYSLPPEQASLPPFY
eukprot:GEMP01020394.1.p1 GENE.GEMP01020394.1~~GEMP01020394.1.p1  ORF type:complete len:425 (+),score=78.48 GEMP01020394.1:317-1591(+)